MQTDVGEGSKATKVPSTVVGRKRKRGNFDEDEMLMLTNMSVAVNNVANALIETRPGHLYANHYLAVMEMPGYFEEAH
jgi:ABC-type Zn uptake system ZnuABC Zn-binding protein ZnuA